MSKSAKRLMPSMPSLPDLPGTSRRQHHSASTKRALVTVASDLFTEHGYAATSLDAIVSAAQMTKGALYHHFTGKQALFEAVFEQIEDESAASITGAVKGIRDPWEKALTALRAFLDVVQQPSYRRIVIQEGPAVLGYERFRQQEERSSYSLVLDVVDNVLRSGPWELEPPMIDTFSRIFFGALSSAGEGVAAAENPEHASQRVETAIGFVLMGLRSLAEQGVELTDPVSGDE